MNDASRSVCFVAFILTGLTAQPVAAQERFVQLDIMQGKVLVDTGEGLELASSGADLTTGDRLVILQNAAAMLSSPETGCVLSLRQPGVAIVPDLTHCGAGQALVLKSKIVIEPANGVYEPVLVVPPPTVDGIAGITPIVAGGAFVATAASTFVFTQVSGIEDEDTPISAY